MNVKDNWKNIEPQELIRKGILLVDQHKPCKICCVPTQYRSMKYKEAVCSEECISILESFGREI